MLKPDGSPLEGKSVEFKKSCPELVKTARDEMGTKSVNYMVLIAPLIGATKQLKIENHVLRTKNDLLECKIASIEESLESAKRERRLILAIATLGGFAIFIR